MIPTPLPAGMEVRDLLEGMLGRDVEIEAGADAVVPTTFPGAVTGVYVDDQLRLSALVVIDQPLAACLGAAIALIPVQTAQSAVDDGFLPPALFDNAAEILNVMASLFNAEGAPHLRLYATYAPGETLPADVATWVPAYVRRNNLAASVKGYGRGLISVLVI
ncbi:MAG TPA: hypothetical protein VMV41_04580 [Cellulomonadaceae bacterium]|nr:hypothetical protein [Cellulomonadaceae bacterium]